MEIIVVGVDGSSGGNAALEYAAREAALKGALMRVVTAWSPPPLVVAGVAAESGFYDGPRSESRQHAAAVASEAVTRAKQMHPSLECEEKVVEGQPAKAIIEQAKDAALIVVGSRGHGGFSGHLLGSVSQQVVQHAHCPVVVIPVLEG
jgi:nucleotide-binding universal stress UspA family protein